MTYTKENTNTLVILTSVLKKGINNITLIVGETGA